MTFTAAGSLDTVWQFSKIWRLPSEGLRASLRAASKRCGDGTRKGAGFTAVARLAYVEDTDSETQWHGNRQSAKASTSYSNVQREGVGVIKGKVASMVFRNEDNCYTVLKIAVDSVNGQSYRGVETAVGYLPAVNTGLAVQLSGTWQTHKSYGHQLLVDTYEEQAPATVKDMQELLGGGTLKGVGKHFSKLLTEHFGMRVEEALDAPDAISQLLKVKGIGKKMATKIKAEWDSTRQHKLALLFFQKHQVELRHAMRLIAYYGSSVVRQVKTDPYAATRSLPGMHFRDRDRLAQSLGLPPNFPSRYQAAILFQLAALSWREGHMYIPALQLYNEVVKYLQSLNWGEVDHDKLRTVMWEMHGEELAVVPPAVAQEGRDESDHNYEVQSLGQCFAELLGGSQSVRRASFILTACETSGTTDMVYTGALHAAEVATAQNLRRRMLQPREEVDLNRIERYIEMVERDRDTKLSPQQRQAVMQAASSQVVVLTGGPGCGKTFTTHAIVKLWERHGSEVKLCAPTGRAAQRLGEMCDSSGSTIHRLLEFGVDCVSIDGQEDKKDQKQIFMGTFQRNAENPLELGALVVDEVSMLDMTLAASLLEALPPHARLLIVGDIDQLPPVGAGSFLKDVINSGKFSVVRLTEVFRQAKTSNIVASAHAINKGLMPQMERLQLQDLYSENVAATAARIKTDCLFIEVANAAQAEQAAQLVACTLLPALRPDLDVRKDLQVLSPMKGKFAGVHRLNESFREILNPQSPTHRKTEMSRKEGDHLIVYREGDRVIQIRNDYDKCVLNGEIGHITAVQDEVDLVPKANGQVERVVKRKLTVQFDERVIEAKDRLLKYDSMSLVDLMPAFAMTIHKSQGCEYPCVIMPVCMEHRWMLSRKLLYTGLTRAKSLAIIIGEPAALQRAIKTVDNDKRHSYLQQRLQRKISDQDYMAKSVHVDYVDPNPF
eukprot:jgi/Chlat1/2826/Chrsp187S02922